MIEKDEKEIIRKSDSNHTNEKIVLRNHIIYIFEQAWAMIILALGIIVSNEETAKLGVELMKEGDFIQGLTAFGSGLFMLVVVMVFYLFRWKKTTMTIADGMIVHTVATLNRKVNNILIANISNINLEQNIVESIFGVCKLKLDTNSLSTAETTDLCILLKKKEAQHIKKILASMIAESEEEEYEYEDTTSVERKSAAILLDDDNMEYDIKYSTKEVVLNALVGISVSQLLVAVSILASAYFTLQGMVKEQKDVMTIVSTLLIELSLAATLVGAMVKKMFQDFRFRARRMGDKIYVACGLFKKKQYAVPIDKINAVSIRYTFIGRILKRGYIKVINIGGEKEEADGMKLLLMDTYEALEEKLRILLPEFYLEDLDILIPQEKKVLGLRLIQSICVCAVFYFGELVGVWFYNGGKIPYKAFWWSSVFATGIVLLCIIVYCLKQKTSGIAFTDKYLLVSQGIFGKHLEYIPYDKVQYISFTQGPFESVMKLKRGKVFILANVLSTEQKLGIFSEDIFETLETKMKGTY